MHFLLSSSCSYLNYVWSCDVSVVGAVTAHVLHGNFSLETSAVWLHSGGERIIALLWVVFLGSWGRMCVAWFWIMVYVLKVFLWIEQLDTLSNQKTTFFKEFVLIYSCSLYLQSVVSPSGPVGTCFLPSLTPLLTETVAREGDSCPKRLGNLVLDLCSEVYFGAPYQLY